MKQARAETPIFAWGLGSGRYLHRILREHSATVHVFALDVPAEHSQRVRDVIFGDAILRAALQKRQLQVYLGSPGSLCHRFTELSQGLDDARVHIHRPILSSVPEEARALAKRLESMARSREGANKMGPLLRQNLEQNREAIASARPLRPDYIAQSSDLAFVLAAGPSLAKAKPLLKKCQQKGALVAVDTAMRSLDTLDIYADWVCCIDANAISIQHLPAPKAPGPAESGITSWSDCNFAFSPTACPELIARFKRRFVAVPEGDLFSKAAHEQLDLPILRWHETVLGLALHTAISLSTRKIVLIGADFSFVDGLSHAPDSAFVRRGDALSDDLETFVDGWQQQKLPSDSTLLGFHAGIQEIIRIDKLDAQRHGQNPRHFWALDGGGARIEGCERLALEQFESWLDQQPERPRPANPRSGVESDEGDLAQRLGVVQDILDKLPQANPEELARAFNVGG